MRKVVIIYTSIHHKNTEKLITGISKNVQIDFFKTADAGNINFSNYEIIGFASGIYMGKFHKSIFAFFKQYQNAVPKKAFVMCTSGIGSGRYAKRFALFLQTQGIEILGKFECKGFDTFGLFKLFGGLAKGHPNAKDIANGTAFIKSII